MSSPVVNIAAYQFAPMHDLEALRGELRALCSKDKLRGSILLSKEGVNAFMAGSRAGIDRLLARLRAIPGLEDMPVKESFSDRIPFTRLLVKLKAEIISFGRDVEVGDAPRISATELKSWLDEGRKFHLLDTRNSFEVKLGTFRGAIDPKVESFREFADMAPKLVERLSDAPVVTFCTGGIRCEKAAPYLRNLGLENVYQLDGGILKYFEQCGSAHYDGECFVFDQRVALNPSLDETQTTQCYACQAPLTLDDQRSLLYVEGKSCPHCYRSNEAKHQATLDARRQRLIANTTPLPGSMAATNVRPLKVPGAYGGKTLKELVLGVLGHRGEEFWFRRCDAGQLRRANGEKLTFESIVRTGEKILHYEPDVVEPEVSNDVKFLHEDDWLVVIEKPAPLPMHPSGRFNRNTLEEFLKPLYKPLRLRPAHRLDADTTGVVVLSKSRSVARVLQPHFNRREVEKRYLLRVEGSPPWQETVCEAPISRAPSENGKRELDPEGLAATTRFEVLQRDGETTLLRAFPDSGRTNQIRLHAKALGLPIVGDKAYAEETPTMTRTVDESPLCLHAESLSFIHPATKKRVEYVSAAPAWSRID